MSPIPATSSPTMKQTRINPDSLSDKQRAAYHFQKVSAVLADFGYLT